MPKNLPDHRSDLVLHINQNWCLISNMINEAVPTTYEFICANHHCVGLFNHDTYPSVSISSWCEYKTCEDVFEDGR
jgi:hypothetical protein